MRINSEFDNQNEENATLKSEPRTKKPKKKVKKMPLMNKIIIAVSMVLLLIFGCVASIVMMGNDYIGLIRKDKSGYTINTNVTIDPNDMVDEDNIDAASRSLIDGNALDFYKNGEAAEASWVKNILLIGTDVRESSSWNGNSDSMIMLSINSKTKTITLTSFMRDMYIYIPDADKFAKLNYSNAYGGGELVCKTITGNFKVKVDQYFRVDFYGLMDIINAAGGVDINVTQEEIAVANNYIREVAQYANYSPDKNYITKAGMQRLNGIQAVAYSRIRYVGNADYQRTKRQRDVLSQVFNNCKSMSVKQIDAFAKKALPNLTTNMDKDDIWAMIANAVTYLGYDLVSQRVPFDDTSTGKVIDTQSMLVPDLKKNAEMLIKSIYGE